MTTPLKIGIIRYANSIPFGAGLGGDIEVVYDHPAGLARRMLGGEFDAAFVPTVSYFGMQHQVTQVAGLSISSIGCTHSVLLLSRVRPEAIETLALYPESRTSNAVAQVILKERYGIVPALCPDGIRADARVVIGDRALEAPRTAWVLDLGEEWLALTGLPMVYAVCVARNPDLAARVAPLLSERRDWNLRHLPEVLAARGSQRYENYLRGLDYGFDDRHRKALDRIRILTAALTPAANQPRDDSTRTWPGEATDAR